MDEIDIILAREIEENNTPSLQYVIFDKEKILHKFYSGYADLKNQKCTDEKTSCHLFSVTKTFTALAVLQLAEKKQLDIDQPAFIYIPGFAFPPEITVRQLLTHTAGIPNPVPLKWIHLAEEHQQFDCNDFFSEIFKKNSRVLSKPGERFSYSNLGYVLLGQLIENISGLSYKDNIRENIIKPLNLAPNELDFEITGFSGLAKGYQKKNSFTNIILGLLIDKGKYMDKSEGKWKPFKPNYVNGPSYGGLIGTSNAIMTYIRELLNPDSMLISDEHKKMLFSETLTNAGKPTGMCFSWFTGELNGHRYYTHAGGGGGYYCEIRIYPGPGLGSVIMFNRTGMRDERFLDKPDKFFLK
jgi:CubicO group peptidase (beta-lactamase class C family)